MEILELNNGIRVINFSSPHQFVFDDGNVLNALNYIQVQEGTANIESEVIHRLRKYEIVSIRANAGNDFWKKIKLHQSLFVENKIDVSIVSEVVLNTLKANNYPVLESPFRKCFMLDRINKIVSSTKFVI
jgi:hypothetical protein